MKSIKFALLGFLVLSLVCACGDPPIVVQGAVTSFDEKAKTLELQDETKTTDILSFSLANAEMGAPPKVGDVVRLSYRAKDGRNLAIRVMNVTNQSTPKK